jgi:uncharacterized protein (TIGR03118 family)
MLLSAGRAWAFYAQTNLVSDLPGVAEFQDPDLVNPWGMATGGGPIWVSDNGSDLSTLYNTAGQKQGLVVSIPSMAPTGQVFNPNPATDFGGAHFIFASENGGIDAWSSGTAAITEKPTSASDVYKGLALGTSSQGATLYATNFRSGKIDTFNSSRPFYCPVAKFFCFARSLWSGPISTGRSCVMNPSSTLPT